MISDIDDILLSINLALRFIDKTKINPEEHKFSNSLQLAVEDKRAILTMLTKSKRKLKRMQRET